MTTPNTTTTSQPDDPDDSTADPYASMKLLGYGILLPGVAVPGIVMNCLSAFIFARRIHLRVAMARAPIRFNTTFSLDVLLLSLSTYDALLLLFSMAVFPVRNVCPLVVKDATWVCAALVRLLPWTFPLLLLAQFCSVWTCVAIACDRGVVVFFPLARRRFCTRGVCLCAVAVVLASGITYRLPAFFALRFNRAGGFVMPTALMRSAWYGLVYKSVLYTTLMFALPWLVILMLSGLIVWRIITRRKSVLLKLITIDKQRRGREMRRTLAASVVCLTFIVFNLPATFTNIAEKVYPEWSGGPVIVLVSSLCVCINSATNWIIYSVTATSFRKQILALLLPCWYKFGTSDAQSAAPLTPEQSPGPHRTMSDPCMCRMAMPPGTFCRICHAPHACPGSFKVQRPEVTATLTTRTYRFPRPASVANLIADV